MHSTTQPSYVIQFSRKIDCVEICHSEFAHNLMCVASYKKLTLGLIWFPDDSDTESFEWERLKDIYHESRCHAICFAPDSTLLPMPKSVTFCAAGADYLLRIYRTDLQNSDTVQSLKGHSSYINGVAWSSEGEYLASVSDDHSCKIWNADGDFESVTTFCLTSAGMSVKWHAEEPCKLLVAEKKGIVRLYNIRSQQAIVSVRTSKSRSCHSSYINGVAWSSEGEYLASVSDDHSCKIWNADGDFESVTTFCLTSAGMSVKWHTEEPCKLLVAEKKGIVRLYNIRSQQAIVSVRTSKSPLMYADWSINNHLFIMALSGGDIYTWDVRNPCAPVDIKQIHVDGGCIAKFSPKTEHIVASIGRPDITLKVSTSKSAVPLIDAKLQLYGCLAWHSRLPYVVATCDRKVCFWKVQIK